MAVIKAKTAGRNFQFIGGIKINVFAFFQRGNDFELPVNRFGGMMIASGPNSSLT